MGVMMGRIVEVNGREVQLVLQALDEEDLIKQVDAINEMERKAKAFDEVKKYASNKYDEFEERKESAGNIEEFEYYETLQIAKKAIISKCKQLEDE